MEFKGNKFHATFQANVNEPIEKDLKLPTPPLLHGEEL